jgi:hypothetical protein
VLALFYTGFGKDDAGREVLGGNWACVRGHIVAKRDADMVHLLWYSA